VIKSIEITEHICQRYMERINPNLFSIADYNMRLKAAQKAIKSILQDARYISDDKRGVLLRSDIFRCDLIVQRCVLLTIYPSKKFSSRQHYSEQAHSHYPLKAEVRASTESGS
jgi:hypothetical protein